MRSFFRPLALCGLATSLLGCSGGEGSGIAQGQSGTAPASADVTGSWSGSWMSRTGVSGSTTSRFTQSGASVTGEVSFTGSPCFAGGAFEGTMTGNDLLGMVSAGRIRVRFDGTLSGNSINGTYLALEAGACSGDTGTFTVAR